jgi:AcrR family transcriptional regulator
VLEAALPVFARRGYRGASMDEIASAAEVAKPVLYDCFPSKSELFRALVEREQARLFELMIGSIPAAPDPTDVEGTLVAGFTALFTAAEAAPDSWRVVFSAGGADPEAAERTARARELVVARMQEAIQSVLAARGGADPRRAALLANLAVGMADAGVRMLLAEPERWSAAELGAEIGRMAALAEPAAR